jgi:hypothetical protein
VTREAAYGRRRRIPARRPIQFRAAKDVLLGENRMELNVVPAFSLRATPTLSVIPAPSRARMHGRCAAFTIDVSVLRYTPGIEHPGPRPCPPRHTPTTTAAWIATRGLSLH